MSRDNVNKVILVGHLGQTPDLRYTAKGNPVLTLSLATNREFKTADGEKKKETAWHKATVWGKRAENCAKFLTKGSRVYVEGELRMPSYTDKDGVVRKAPEINVDDIRFLGGGVPSGMKAESNEPIAPVFSQ